MDTGVLLNIDINLARPIPVNTPTIPPMEVSTTASVKNWNRMAFFLAPMAFLRPISFVLSVTVTNIMFITPIPPTSKEIPAIQINMAFVDLERF